MLKDVAFKKTSIPLNRRNNKIFLSFIQAKNKAHFLNKIGEILKEENILNGNI